MAQNTIIIYQRKIINKKNKNAVFYKDFALYDGITYETTLSNDAKKQVQQSGVEFPIALSIDDGDYFLKSKRFVRSDGTMGRKWVLVILNCHDIKHTEFKKMTLEEITAKIHEELSHRDLPEEALDNALHK